MCSGTRSAAALREKQQPERKAAPPAFPTAIPCRQPTADSRPSSPPFVVRPQAVQLLVVNRRLIDGVEVLGVVGEAVNVALGGVGDVGLLVRVPGLVGL